MFAAKALTKAVPTARSVIQVRNMTAVSGPPKTRISFAEKVAHGAFMTGCYMAIPAWVLYHVSDYRGHE